jgi:hypothetical protein
VGSEQISRNQCGHYGAALIAPEWSEHFPDHRIEKVWSCKACGYAAIFYFGISVFGIVETADVKPKAAFAR